MVNSSNDKRRSSGGSDSCLPTKGSGPVNNGSNSRPTSRTGTAPRVAGNAMPGTNAPAFVNGGNVKAPKFGTYIPCRIFVGGLAQNATQKELEDLFSPFGSVQDCKIISDRAGVTKGYGFVTFSNDDEAAKVFTHSEPFFLHERPLNISRAIKKQPFRQDAVASLGQRHFPSVSAMGSTSMPGSPIRRQTPTSPPPAVASPPPQAAYLPQQNAMPYYQYPLQYQTYSPNAAATSQVPVYPSGYDMMHHTNNGMPGYVVCSPPYGHHMQPFYGMYGQGYMSNVVPAYQSITPYQQQPMAPPQTTPVSGAMEHNNNNSSHYGGEYPGTPAMYAQGELLQRTISHQQALRYHALNQNFGGSGDQMSLLTPNNSGEAECYNFERNSSYDCNYSTTTAMPALQRGHLSNNSQQQEVNYMRSPPNSQRFGQNGEQLPLVAPIQHPPSRNNNRRHNPQNGRFPRMEHGLRRRFPHPTSQQRAPALAELSDDIQGLNLY